MLMLYRIRDRNIEQSIQTPNETLLSFQESLTAALLSALESGALSAEVLQTSAVLQKVELRQYDL